MSENTSNVSEIKDLQDKLIEFAEARDWEQFQSPKNLSMALAVEASEIMEHFQWLNDEQSRQLEPQKHKAVSYELADVFMYTLLMAKRMNINIANVTREKMAINQQRYPADKVKGSAKKYSEYDK